MARGGVDYLGRRRQLLFLAITEGCWLVLFLLDIFIAFILNFFVLQRPFPCRSLDKVLFLVREKLLESGLLRLSIMHSPVLGNLLKWNSLFLLLVDSKADFATVRNIGRHQRLLVQEIKDQIIEGCSSVQIVDVHTVFLADSMSTVFSLVHDGRGPGQLCKDHAACCCQRKSLGRSSNA